MTDTPTPWTFDAAGGLPDWRVLLGALEATYQAASAEQGVAFTVDVVAAGDASGLRPEVDLRPPHVVHVTVREVSGAAVELAAAVSELAARAGLASRPWSATRLEIAIDAIDIDAVRPFWKAVLGYDDEPGGAIVDPLGIGPAFWFQQMDAPSPQRNRIHIDVTVPHDVADERVAAAIEAGGTLVSDARARAFWVLADPEGNEACVCTWQDRG